MHDTANLGNKNVKKKRKENHIGIIDAILKSLSIRQQLVWTLNVCCDEASNK